MKKRHNMSLPTSVSSGGRPNVHIGDEVGGDLDWRKNCNNLREKCLYMWTNTEKYGWSQDVTFEVGSVEKVRFTAHRLILIAGSQYFEDLFKTNTNTSRDKPLKFPQLDPVGFKKVLDYIYSNNFDISKSDPKDTRAILDAAKLFKITALVTKCYASLRLQITSETAAELFHLAKEGKDKRLEELTRAHIINHIAEVFSSQRFLQLSEGALCTLLKMDDWYLKEIHVFQHVKRWCLSKHSKLSSDSQSGDVKGELMRAAMGQAFYEIRFPLMSKDEFFKEVLGDNHSGLFSGDEIQQFAEYFYSLTSTLSQTCLQGFVSRQRVKPAPLPTPSTSTAGVNAENTSRKIGSSGTHKKTGRKNTLIPSRGKVSVASSLSAKLPSPNTTIKTTSSQQVTVIPPPAKKARLENPTGHEIKLLNNSSSTSSQTLTNPSRVQTLQTSTDQSSTQTVQKYINALERGTEKGAIKILNETLLYASLPYTHVHLPHLSDFRLGLESKLLFASGSEFKRYVKEKTEKLDRLLFFDKAGPNVSKFSKVTKNDLNILLRQKVNISLQFDDCIAFKINYEEGELVMNLLTCAQDIVDILKDFPLKKLAISECDLTSLESLKRDLLETIVIHNVKMKNQLNNGRKFLQGCSSLREVAWNGFGSGSGCLVLGEDLIFNNPHLQKLSLGNGTFCLPAVPKSPGWQSSVRELYVDMRECTYASNPGCLNSYPLMYPSLKRLQICDGKIESMFLYNILKIETIEWIFVWEMELNRRDFYKNGKLEKGLTDEAKSVHKFLSKVFLSDPKSESDWPTFILRKKASQPSQGQPGKSATIAKKFDPFDDTKWKGEKVPEENRKATVKKLDFQHYSLNKFYSSYDSFSWMESN